MRKYFYLAVSFLILILRAEPSLAEIKQDFESEESACLSFSSSPIVPLSVSLAVNTFTFFVLNGIYALFKRQERNWLPAELRALFWVNTGSVLGFAILKLGISRALEDGQWRLCDGWSFWSY